MSESADLLAAVAAAPADDLPRLVYADWLDDRGEADHATFVRDQIRLAQVPSWDPLAVRARHQRKETLGIGRPFYGTLPELPLFLKWHPEKAFRRGFGTGVVVNQLSGLIEAGPQLFDLAPVDELWLGAASLDEWRTVARSPWLKHIRKVHLHFSQSLHEPIRCLAESPYSGNIDEIWFDTLATPAAGAVIEILAQSPLARQLTGLHMRLVHTPSLPEVIAALAGGKFERLERFSMVQAGLDEFQVRDLLDLPSIKRNKFLDLSLNPTGYRPFRDIIERQTLDRCHTLLASNCVAIEDYEYDRSYSITRKNDTLKLLDFSNHPYFHNFDPFFWMINAVKCLIFRTPPFDDLDFISLLDRPIWNEITELDLCNYNIAKSNIRRLCHRDIPQSMTAFVVTKSIMGQDSIQLLESHFGDRLVWAAEDAATGLAR